MLHPINKARYLQRKDNSGIGRMLLVSIALHLVVVILLGGYLLPKYTPIKKPVYFVDLLHKPVVKPRAGRPDAAVSKKTTPAKKAQKKTEPKPEKKPAIVAQVPAKKVEPVKLPVESKQTKPAEKKAPKIEKVEPKKISQPLVKPVVESNPLDAIEQMRNKQRIAALKRELDSLAHTQTPATTAPVGVVGARGTQAGVDFTSWIKTYLSAAWALPSHYLQRGLVGKMLLRFDRNGRLVYSELLSSSGDSFFDASIKRAVQQLQQLPSAPEKQLELIITFDPKELLSR